MSTRHPVALAAKIVELIGGKLSGVARPDFRRVLDMARGWSMTAFTAHPRLVRLNHLVWRDLQRTGRVASETAQDSRFGIKNPVPYAARRLVPRRAADAIEPAVPGFVKFDIGFGIEPVDECDGLVTRAKRPESGLGRFGRRQRPRVRAGRLSCKLRRMAFGADRGPGVISRRNAHEEIERQQGERTELSESGQARILGDHQSTPTCRM